MAGKTLRGAVVGASSLLGKDLAEELNASTSFLWDLLLLDAEDTAGQITSAGDEALMIQAISAESFIGVDIVFFTEAKTATEFWKSAHAAGAGIVDLSGALEGEPQVIVRSSWIKGSPLPDLGTIAVVAANPASMMLALLVQGLSSLSLSRLAATILQPASEQGGAGVDELHQQTVGLLTFQPLKQEVYDAQVAFTLKTAVGSASRVDLASVATKIRRQVQTLLGEDTKTPLALQLVHAPVFHGYTVSVFVEFVDNTTVKELIKALQGPAMTLAQVDEPGPSNDSVAGLGEVIFTVESAVSGPVDTNSFWLWLAADNLRLAARNAVLCAGELAALRPTTDVN